MDTIERAPRPTSKRDVVSVLDLEPTLRDIVGVSWSASCSPDEKATCQLGLLLLLYDNLTAFRPERRLVPSLTENEHAGFNVIVGDVAKALKFDKAGEVHELNLEPFQRTFGPALSRLSGAARGLGGCCRGADPGSL